MDATRPWVAPVNAFRASHHAESSAGPKEFARTVRLHRALRLADLTLGSRTLRQSSCHPACDFVRIMVAWRKVGDKGGLPRAQPVMPSPEDPIPEELIAALCPDIVTCRQTRLTGGVSADTFELALTNLEGDVERVVVRRRSPSSARGGLSTEHEHALLLAIQSSDVPVPRPRSLWSADTLVLTWIEGTSDLPSHGPSVMAETLARIHAQRGAALEALPAREDPTPVLERSLVTFGLHALAPLATAAAERCLLHGDFWPGNILWRDGELVAVIDWEDAAVGDPLSDVACARVELEVAAGGAAASRFTERYLASTGRDLTRLALWDVYVSATALESMDSWGLPDEILEHRRAVTRAFHDEAIGALRRLGGDGS